MGIYTDIQGAPYINDESDVHLPQPQQKKEVANCFILILILSPPPPLFFYRVFGRTTAGTQCHWSDFDHTPHTQTLILLGVKDVTRTATRAGDGLQLQILRATAKFVREASKERRS
jgi:hypothetical protein